MGITIMILTDLGHIIVQMIVLVLRIVLGVEIDTGGNWYANLIIV